MDRNYKDTKEKEELFGRLAGRLRIDSVPPLMRERLELDGCVDDVLNPNYAYSWEEFVDKAKGELQYARAIVSYVDTQRSGQGGGEEDHRTFRPSPDDPVNERAGAFSLYIAKVADEDDEVKQFRQEVLGGSPVLSEQEAEEFLFSLAIQVFSSDWFRENSVPLLGHRAQILKPERVYPKVPRRRWGRMKVEWDGGALVAPFDSTAWLPYTLWGAAGSDPLPTMEGSVGSSLLDLRGHLIERFPWDSSEALMYVLTGAVPWIEPIIAVLPEGSPDRYETVNITVWPWVPVEDVARLYSRVRQELDPKSATSRRRLALFKFVMQHPGVRVLHEGQMPEVPTWRELFHEWNEQHPQGDKYHYSDLRNFQKSVRAAFDQIVNFYPSDTWYSRVRSERDRLDRTGDGSMATIRVLDTYSGIQKY